MLFSATANKNNSFEIIALQFRDDVTFEDQEAAMASLNPIVHTAPGFQSRDYYYSGANSHWIEFIVWEDEDSAKAASKSMMSNDEAIAVFCLIDEKTMLFSHYQHKGGTAA